VIANFHTTTTLSPGKGPQYPLDRRRDVLRASLDAAKKIDIFYSAWHPTPIPRQSSPLSSHFTD
jgi:hypothetical protein